MKGSFCFQIANFRAFFQASLERHSNGKPFLALRVFAGSPPGLQGPVREDLLVALGLHDDGALVFRGPLFEMGGGGGDDTEPDSGMSVEQEEGDGDDDKDDDKDNKDEVQIVHECITID